MAHRWITLFGLLALTALPQDATAYTIDSVATRGCHEEISASALRAVRRELPTAKPLPSTGADDAPLIDDVAFSLPDDMRDIGGTTFLLGIRDNDLKNISATDIEHLAALNSDPAAQREHCLRKDSQKEPTGSKEAVADCRGFIHDMLMSSLDGLGADGTPDPKTRETVEVSLAIRGQVKVDVPMFYLRAGRALHAVEDSFTHTFRSKSDRHKITVVLNWIGYANNSLDETTDGPPHMSGMDRCDDPDQLLTERRKLATEAVTQALRAVLDPSLTRDQKDAAITAMLDAYISFDETAGCTAANHWCNAAENEYRPSGCGCELAGGPAGRGAWFAGGLGVAAAFLALGRRRRRTLSGRSAVLLSVGTAAAGALLAPDALTQTNDATAPTEPPASGSAASSAAPIPTQVRENAPTHETTGPIAALKGKSKSAIPGTEEPAGALFGRVFGGASYDHPAAAVGLGGRYQLGRPWMIGLDGEWNPWISSNPKKVRSGALNVYASLIRRYQLAYEKVNFRSTVSLGASYLLIDLVGAPKGSIGPFFGLSFLGVEFKLMRGFFLTVDPTYIAFPVPHVFTGAPFGYYQYRFMVGLEFGG